MNIPTTDLPTPIPVTAVTPISLLTLLIVVVLSLVVICLLRTVDGRGIDFLVGDTSCSPAGDSPSTSVLVCTAARTVGPYSTDYAGDVPQWFARLTSGATPWRGDHTPGAVNRQRSQSGGRHGGTRHTVQGGVCGATRLNGRLPWPIWWSRSASALAQHRTSPASYRWPSDEEAVLSLSW